MTASGPMRPVSCVVRSMSYARKSNISRKPDKVLAELPVANDGREGNVMGLYFWAIVGGLVGTGLMDIAEKFMQGLKITSRGS